MMGALPPVSPWTPEDDLLLKNAVEAGASLESLAKGAIRFSRKFSIREIQERWHSLLYDPDVSSEAAQQMIEVERCTSNLTNNKSSRTEATNDSKEGRKRKFENVRKSYYAMRKRIRDLNYFVSPVGNGHDDGNEVFCPSNIQENPKGSHFELGKTNFDGVHRVFDNRDKGQLENYSAVGGADLTKDLHVPDQFEDDIDVNTMGDGDKNKDNDFYACLEGSHVFSSPVPECDASFRHLQYSSPPRAIPEMEMATDFESHIPHDEMKAYSSCAQLGFDGLSDTLFNLSDDDGMLMMDYDDGKEIDKYGLSNLLLDSPSDMMNEDQMLDATQPEAPVLKEQLDKSDSVLDGPKISSRCDINPQIHESRNDVIFCSLNTEDLEVPYNDHVIFPPKARLVSLNRKDFNKVGRRDLFMKDNLHRENVNETGLSLVNRELKRFGELHTDSQPRGNKTGLNHGSQINLQLPKSTSFATNSRLPGNGSCSTLIIRTVPSENGSRKQPCPSVPELPVKSSDPSASSFDSVAVKKPEVITILKPADGIAPETVAEPLLCTVYEDDYNDDEEEVPCYSDVESWVLQLDLVPKDHDSYASRQVAMYESDDLKKKIVRWEQGSRASMHRAMAHRGAFAVLFNRYAIHFIKKTEVLLGRATGDAAVDIDLGKEAGRANKISRRQAIIRMDGDGEFHLVNLGKCLISVGDKEVCPGQSFILTSRCCVEIRGMYFIFDKYDAPIKRYLDARSRGNPPN